VPNSAEALLDHMVSEARRNPDKSFVTWKFNNGEWQTTTGSEFLELWDQAVAGTIYIDHVVITE
jgi:hypothetical protein